MNCYCCSGLLFSKCCQPLLEGTATADSCLQLMRSRYSAYCSKNIEYIFQSYHPEQREANSKAQIEEFADTVHFVGLTISDWSQSQAPLHGDSGSVSFVARYIFSNKLETLTEKSRFTLNDRWYYYDGEIAASTVLNIGRNDRCPCGSGKKFKQCIVHLLSGSILTTPS
ncbi:SEC-C motif-containing protein [Arsukibacterium tuosuense]|uniref:SEC-C motif-containing protein n=2 Tax=Arsukibacterium tuosuense TaxID=1323745 RepID=A0A285IUM7_9GAMM|nr:SEC-C motif-containing protein [Arsukibacterium tuosuense]